MFEYGRVGELAGAGPGNHLLLPEGRPLSYLRVGTEPSNSQGLTQALLEHEATELRVRIPVVADPGTGSSQIGPALRDSTVSSVFPVLTGTCELSGEVEVCWLDQAQAATLRLRTGTGFARRSQPVATAGLRLKPTFELSSRPEPADRSWQYWNSGWEFANRPDDRENWWRVRPNETRRRAHWLFSAGTGKGPEARGTFAACLHPTMKAALGNPPYVVIEHPFRTGRIAVLVLPDEFRGMGQDVWRETIFLDRTARDALGLLDGEFCVVHPWTHPRRALWRRRARDRLVGARTIAAHPRAPARADLEKPVCRLSPEALETIGGQGGEFVQIERIARPPDAEPGRWEVVRVSQRVLPIHHAEEERRSRWEAPQTWDERSAYAQADVAPDLEGYVDCAERLGLYPPYPAIYLNYYTRKHTLRGLGLCEPIQVRVGVAHRLAAEASEFVWLAVIALLGAAIAFLDSSLWQATAAVLLLAMTAFLLLFRAIRAVR